MYSLIRLFSIALLAALIAGCAGFTRQAYYPASDVKLKQILIVTPAEFPKVRVGVEGNMGMMFGAVGAIAATHDIGELSQMLDQAISSQGVVYQRQLLEKLSANLSAAGIRTETVAVKREGRAWLVEDYKPLVADKKDVDAVLDIFVTEASYGGTHPMLDPELRPILRMRARLVSAKTFETLYANDIFFGYSNPFMTAQEIKAPKQYYYPNLQAVLADKAKAADGMRVAATEVANFLTGQFINPQATIVRK